MSWCFGCGQYGQADDGIGCVCEPEGTPELVKRNLSTPENRAFWKSLRESEVLDEVRAERERQDVEFGEQNHPDGTGGAGAKDRADEARQLCDDRFRHGRGTWRLILEEEVAEAFAESDPARLREELVQCAAVCVAWVAAFDRRGKK